MTERYFRANARLRPWLQCVGGEFSRPYINHLRCFLRSEVGAGQGAIYPATENIFAALKATPPNEIKVVIVGQDPYHNGRADGLAFSMLGEGRLGNSCLMKILKAVNRDLCEEIPTDGRIRSLRGWANQGVLLLNSVLSVRSRDPKSHCCQGWEKLTDQIVQRISEQRRNLVFLLWGDQAICKRPIISTENGHLVLSSVHPRVEKFKEDVDHFSKANEYLHDRAVDWTALHEQD